MVQSCQYAGIQRLSGTRLARPQSVTKHASCIDCPEAYDEISLDFTLDTVTSWMESFEVYYDSRWLIYGGGTGSHDVNKP